MFYSLYIENQKTIREITLHHEKMMDTALGIVTQGLTIINFLYQMLMNSYGLQAVAEKRFIQFILGLRQRSCETPMFSLFSSFLGILPQNEGDLEFYLKGFYFMTKRCTLGPSINQKEANILPLIRASEFVRHYFAPRLNPEECKKLKDKVESLKILDGSWVKIDAVLNVALVKYRSLLAITQDYVKDIFNACDLDGNKRIDLQEFLLLARCLEPENLPKNKALLLFNKLCDPTLDLSNENKYISFQNFAIGCVENSIFSEASQNRFLGIREKSECWSSLINMNVQDRLRIIEVRFLDVSQSTSFVIDWINSVKRACKNLTRENANVVLIKLKLIEQKSIFVYQQYRSASLLGPLNLLLEQF